MWGLLRKASAFYFYEKRWFVRANLIGLIMFSANALSIEEDFLSYLSRPMSAVVASDTRLNWGSETTIYLSSNLLRDMEIELTDIKPDARINIGEPGKANHILRFPVLAGAFEFRSSMGVIEQLLGGALQHRDGFRLLYPAGKVDLQSFFLRPRMDSSLGLALMDKDGVTWFTTDHIHAMLQNNEMRFVMQNMNLRLSAHFAEVLGHSEWTGLVVGGITTQANALVNSLSVVTASTDACTAPWPASGLNTDIELYQYTDGSGPEGHPDTINAMRCDIPLGGGSYSACTSNSTNGWVVIASDSSLINIGNTGVAWYQKFNRNQSAIGPPVIREGDPRPPYNNDQHPLLIWNLYRLDATGRIKQIGASAVKHAYFAANMGCYAPPANTQPCEGGHVAWPQCKDTYAVFHNDTLTTVRAPRSEIIPAAGVWGRCGSAFDPGCLGAFTAGEDLDLHDRRMNVLESDMLASLNSGAQYYFEYWYVVRDDQNIYNTMGTRTIIPTKSGAMWFVDAPGAPAAGSLVLGPAINRWVDPVNPTAGAMNQELAAPEGHARIAVKTSALGAGWYHYEYAVMNLDFARAVIDPVHNTDNLIVHPQGLKVLSNLGFNRFEVPITTGINVTNIQFSADSTHADNWSSAVQNGTVSWQAPIGNELNWGILYRFSFDANVEPRLAVSRLGVATAGSPTNYLVSTLGPLTDRVFFNGFE